MSSNQEIPAPVLIEDLGSIYPNSNSKHKSRYGIYKCACGKEFIAQSNNIKIGAIKSCGCYNIYKIKLRSITHGIRSHRIYSIWRHMIDRTENIKDKRFSSYGGRGISICQEWRYNVKAFYDWSIENGYKDGLTIDRINNDGNYEPSNCRWVTRNVQARNTRVLMSTNTSGYRGVSWNNQHNKWIAVICVNNKNKRIGSFNDKLQAAKAYDAYVIENNLQHTINGV